MSTSDTLEVTCFDCGERIGGADVDAVVEGFVAHGRERHDAWPYPEAAIRNFARNVAEASLRITGPTERLPEIGVVVVHPVTEDRVDDWVRFFDRDAFAGNPDWGSCYCLEPHEPAPPEMPERPWRDVRAAMVARLRGGGSYGYLAYVDGRPAGWVNASLRSSYGLYGDVDPDGPEPRTVVGVSCFIVAPPFRRHGIASTLLDRVILDAPTRGATWIEGYPHDRPEEGDAGHFRGTRSMYEARGFRPVEGRQRSTVMRRRA